MTRALILAAATTAALAAVPAFARNPVWPADQLGQEASFPFENTIGLFNFHVDVDRGLWLQDRRRRWYYAVVTQPCTHLPFAREVAVDTRFGATRLDRNGALIIDDQACRISSLTKSNGPPHRSKNGHRVAPDR